MLGATFTDNADGCKILFSCSSNDVQRQVLGALSPRENRFLLDLQMIHWYALLQDVSCK